MRLFVPAVLLQDGEHAVGGLEERLPVRACSGSRQDGAQRGLFVQLTLAAAALFMSTGGYTAAASAASPSAFDRARPLCPRPYDGRGAVFTGWIQTGRDRPGTTAPYVLLASNIDPGWTSVFPLIAGLVTETGRILSHGAILAREYGIPTVTSLDGAMALLPAGTRITVDGTAGTVTILESAEPAGGAPDLPV
ncbi:hypothetical protein HUX53_02810 [Actinomadura sp. BRA 177]|nr:hypothetical protein [Actinomadura sp. BRA 177]